MHLEILRKIGYSIGNLIGIDASYKFCNSVKFLINDKNKLWNTMQLSSLQTNLYTT
jgi:hypothetical protein